MESLIQVIISGASAVNVAASIVESTENSFIITQTQNLEKQGRQMKIIAQQNYTKVSAVAWYTFETYRASCSKHTQEKKKPLEDCISVDVCVPLCFRIPFNLVASNNANE